jgi:PPOX class probable F420-dependent enzyme
VRAERPSFEASYGIADGSSGLLDWAWVIEELTKSRSYWVVTVRPDGRPHAMPVWGVWLDDALLFSTGAKSVKARNLARDPRAVVHLESGDDAVILEGAVSLATLAPEQHSRLVAAYAAKYDLWPEDLPGADGWYTLRPATALAWQEHDFPNTATRFRA